jgi:tetratricopeptide (TPR) repeat protein
MLDIQASQAAVTVIGGMPGVGKTTLAVRWGRRHLDRFTDGQLYVNLRGFDPTGKPVQPAEAVRRFLDALQIPVAMIPADLDSQTALYRSVVDSKRILILLDNACDADQVRPLLPGSPTCHVLVTSRGRLSSLIACEQAGHIHLELFSTNEARELLGTFFGAARIQADTGAVDDLIERCARLPIALTIAAARAITEPHIQLSVLATELAELSTGDSHDTDIRAVFSWSYNALPPAAATLFRLIGLHPGPDINVHAAASLADMPISLARKLLTKLTMTHLLQEHVSGRYRFHDLLRAYAAERAAEEDPELHREKALRRLFDHYLHTGFAADRLINPDREPITLDAPQPGVVLSEITNNAYAWEWCIAEHASLLAAINYAGQNRFNGHAWRLPWVMATFLDRRGHWHECTAVHEIALTAVDRLGDHTARARTHRFLGWAYTRLRRYDEAFIHLNRALTLWRKLSEPIGQASAYHGISLLAQSQKHYTEALDHAQQALELYRAGQDATGEATALNTLSWNHARLGDHHQAIGEARQALDLFTQLNDHFGQAEARDTLGYTHYHIGLHDQAVSHYQECLILRHKLGDRYLTASALTDLGGIHHAMHRFDEARSNWQQAHTILQQLQHPDAERVHAKLKKLDQPE